LSGGGKALLNWGCDGAALWLPMAELRKSHVRGAQAPWRIGVHAVKNAAIHNRSITG